MEGSRILIFILGVGLCFGEDSQSPRSTRTIARFFGLESNPAPAPQTQQQVQPRKPVPLVYSVKYYDRTGEGEKVEVVPEHGVDGRVQGVPARVFLNLYTGQQTPVYYDNKGQILVPCPVYDHLYVDQPVVRKPSPSKVVQGPVVPAPPQVNVPQVQPLVTPEIVYYASPSFVGNPNPVPQKPPGVTVVGVPYDYPYYPGIFPFGGGGYNPYFYIKPNGQVGGHSHHQVVSSSSQVQQVEKKEVEKTD